MNDVLLQELLCCGDCQASADMPGPAALLLCCCQFDNFQGMLAEAVAQQALRMLEALGHRLPSNPSQHKMPMLLEWPGHELIGRREEAQRVAEALRAGRSVFIFGGPGEGKSMLARSVGVALWEEGSLLGGAFEVDLTSDPWG